MRKSTIKNVLLGIAFGVFFIGSLKFIGNCDYNDEMGYIERKGTYYETGDDRYIITEDGNIWNVCVSQFENGTKVNVRFDFKGTPEAEDDEIVEVTKRIY